MEDTLKRYVDKVLEIQDQENALSDSELRDIAKEIGLSQDDLAAIDKKVAEDERRAIGFMKHAIWSDAISEWKEVIALSPNHVTVRANLSFCYLKNGDHRNARLMADSALKADPSNTQAFEVLGQLSKRKSLNSILVMTVGTFALGFLLAFGMVAYQGSKEQNTIPDQKDKLVIESKTVKGLVESKDQSGFAVESNLPEGLDFEAHLSEYTNYDDSSYYKLIGKIKNNTTQEIPELKGTITYGLADGNSFQEVTDIHADHQAVLRPGDFAHFDLLQKISNTSLKSVKLNVEISGETPALRKYPKSKEIEFSWGEIETERYKISISERDQSLGSVSSFGQFHKATWEVKNLGRTIRNLKMGVRYFSKENEELADKFFYVTSSSDSPLTTEEVRVAHSIEKLPPKKFHRYELRVLNVE